MKYIAEIGINHKGSEARAMMILRKLVETKVDAITFQILKPSFYEKNKLYGKPLSLLFYKKAIGFTHKNGKLIGFAISNEDMVKELNKYGADFWKILSVDTKNYKLHKLLKKTKKRIFLSTGLSNEKDILMANKNLKDLIIIHTQLSHNIEDTNLNMMNRLKYLTGKKIAFGLHCSNHYVLYLALAFKPTSFFFYVKERTNEVYPDDKHALFIDEIDDVLQKSKALKKALGDGIKKKVKVNI